MLAIMTVWVTIQGNGHFARNGIINTVSDPGLPMPCVPALCLSTGKWVVLLEAEHYALGHGFGRKVVSTLVVDTGVI
jgi:uncharacterized membrane protein